MNLLMQNRFLYFYSLPMQGHSPQQTPQKKKVKLSLKSNDPQHVNLEIEEALMNLAINKSYTKQMAKSGPLDVSQTLEAVGNFIFKFIPREDNQKALEEYWCIIALNEQTLQSTKKGNGFCSTGNTPITVDQKRLKLYQLFIGLGFREYRLQSLADSDKIWNFNIDTVETILAYEDVFHPQSSNRIRLIIDGKYDLDFYITLSTLPFGGKQSRSPHQNLQLCSAIAQNTLKIIKSSIEQSKGKLYKMRSEALPQKDEFYYNRYVTEQQFSKYCETGDVILFKDNHTFAKVQRFITNSECDHIGVVFRDQKYGLCIFQSNSGTGVSLAMWNQLIRYKWFQNIEGIYWRRLNMQKKAENFEEKVREFVKVNLHKQYGFSLGKLLRFKQIVYQNAEQEKNRTYFCSELVAALYKYLGLLEQGKSSSNYIPKDFTDKGSLNMINNTALEAERRIIFDPNLLKESYRFYK